MRRARLTSGWTTLLLLALPLAACGTTGTGAAIYTGAGSATAAADSTDPGVPGTGTTDLGSRFVGSSQPIGGLTVETAPVDLGGASAWPPAPIAAPAPVPLQRGAIPPRPPPPSILPSPLDPSRTDLPGQPIR